MEMNIFTTAGTSTESTGHIYTTSQTGQSSLEMLRLSCEQLQHVQAKTSNTSRVVMENKAAEKICSTYDNMPETEALTILKKKIQKDTTHCHLWMFLIDILMDSSKASVATWEDQKGMFRIRDPTKLADMWGEKRNRTNMTYEKLSRSLRHYYEKKILRKVPKRKYTYKFNSREILKSYEVQPFYRRANSQRNNQSNQNQHSIKSNTSSGQASPFTPVTPLTPVTPSTPSYQVSHFQWPQVSAYQPAWPVANQEPHQQMVSRASPVHLPPTPTTSPVQLSPLNKPCFPHHHRHHHQQQQQQQQQQHHMVQPHQQQQQQQQQQGWNQPQQQYYFPQSPLHAAVPYPVMSTTQSTHYPLPAVSNAPTHYTVQQSSAMPAYQQTPQCHTVQQQQLAPQQQPSMENSKETNIQNEINQLHELLEKPTIIKLPSKPAPLTLNLNNLTTPSVSQQTGFPAYHRSRSESVESRVSTSPESFIEDDDMFNDIVDSLLMDTF